MAPQSIQWGIITLHLDHDTFRASFTQGRQMYFDDRAYDRPHIALQMGTQDVAASVCEEDDKGGYCFDDLAFNNPLDILGFFLGYMSGPILAENCEEQKARSKNVGVFPEVVNPTVTIL